jgi:hypothetical protein
MLDFILLPLGFAMILAGLVEMAWAAAHRLKQVRHLPERFTIPRGLLVFVFGLTNVLDVGERARHEKLSPECQQEFAATAP